MKNEKESVDERAAATPETKRRLARGGKVLPFLKPGVQPRETDSNPDESLEDDRTLERSPPGETDWQSGQVVTLHSPESDVEEDIEPALTEAEFRDKYNIPRRQGSVVLGKRQAEVLDKLELADEPVARAEIKRQCFEVSSTAGSADVYTKAIANLVKRNLLEVKQDTEKLALSELGRQFIVDYHKTYGERRLIVSRQGKLMPDTSYKILDELIESIVRQHGEVVQPYEHWLQPNNSTEDPVTWLQQQIDGISRQTLIRRLHAMANRRRPYIEIQKASRRSVKKSEDKKTNAAGTKTINIRPKLAGVVLHDEVRQKLRENGEMIDEAAAEDISLMVETCIELATQLGEQKRAEILTKQLDKQHPLELCALEFEIYEREITTLLDRLRRDYAFEFSK